MTDNKKEESLDHDPELGKSIQDAAAMFLLLCTYLWLYYGLYQDKMETAAQYGDFFGGFAGTLAFLFLVHSIDLQRRELRAQRKQLEIANAESKAQREVMQAQYNIMQMEAQERARTLYSEAIQQAINGFIDKDEWVRDLERIRRMMHALSRAQKFDGAEVEAQKALPIVQSYMHFFRMLAEETRKYANRTGIELIDNDDGNTITFLNKNLQILLSMPVTLAFRYELTTSLSFLPKDPEGLLLTYIAWFSFQRMGENANHPLEQEERIIDYIAAHGLPRDDMQPWFEYLQSPRIDDIPPPEF